MKRGAPRSAAGQPERNRKLGVQGVVDVINRDQSEEGLRFQASLANQVGGSIMAIDMAGAVTFWNSKAEELYGWKRDEVIGKSAAEVLSAPDPNFLEEGARKELLRSGHWTGEIEVGRKDGSRFPALLTAAAVKTPSGLLTGYSFLSDDISERRDIAKKLHESEEKFRGIAERTFDGIFTTDSKGVYTYVSPAFAKLFGLDPSEMTGRSILERAQSWLDSESDQSRFLEVFREVLNGKVVNAGEFEITRADGSRAFVEANASPVFDGERVVGVQAVVRDVTGRRRAEDELHFQGSLLDQVGNSVITVDLAGTVRYWNRQSEELFGLTKEVVGKAAKEVIAVIDPNSLTGGILQAVKQSGKWSGEVEFGRADGSRFPGMVTATAVKGPSGLVVGYSFVTMDITERKQLEKSLRESEEKFKGMAERSFDGLFTLDAEGNTTYVSPSLFRLTGFAPEELEGIALLKFIPDSSISKVVEAMAKVLEGQTINSFEVEGRRKDGSSLMLEVNAAPVFGLEHSVTAIQGVVRDVTRRDESEKRLRESEEKFRGVVESSFDGVFIIDAQGRISYASPSMDRILGYEPGEMIGLTVDHLLAAREVPRFIQGLADATRGVKSQDMEIEGKRKDGTPVQLEVRASSVFDEVGRLVKVQGVIRDVTERNRAQETERLLASLIQATPMGSVTLDLDGTIVGWNPAAERILGYSAEEVIGSPARVLSPHGDALVRLREGLKELATSRSGLKFQGSWARKDGTRFDFSMDAFPIRDASGKTVRFSGFFQDVSQQKAAEDAKRLLASVVEASPMGIVTIGMDGKISSLNPAAQRIFGYSSEEAIGQPASIGAPQARRTEFIAVMERVKREGKAIHLESVRERKDGSLFDFSMEAFPIKDSSGAVVSISGMFADITEQKAAEDAKRLLASVVEASPLGVLTLGMDGVILSWNRAAGEIYGYSSTETIGRNIAFLNGDGVSSAFPDIVEALKKGGGDVHFEGVRPKKDGSLFPISVEAFQVRDASGETVAISAFFSDITVQKAAEEKVRDLQEARSKFISAATHELKTPLVSIKGYSDLAASGSLGEVPKPLEHGLSVVSRNVDRMLSLIQELLEIERMDNGKVEISKEVVDLTDLIRVSIENLRPIVEGKSLEVDAVLPEGAIHVMGDQKRLAEVMDNLLVNAIKFTPSKGKIRVEMTEEAGEVRVCVADTGIGVSPANLLHLFEPFSKIPKAQSTENQAFGMQSTGLGLAVTKGFVELHGGRIWAESPGEGKGSTFVFTLPSVSH